MQKQAFVLLEWDEECEGFAILGVYPTLESSRTGLEWLTWDKSVIYDDRWYACGTGYEIRQTNSYIGLHQELLTESTGQQ